MWDITLDSSDNPKLQEPTVVVDLDADLSSQLITIGAIHTIKRTWVFSTCSYQCGQNVATEDEL